MPTLSKTTLTFLRNLSQNNTRIWFTSHKDEYIKAREEFSDFVQALAEDITRFDAEVRKSIIDSKTVKIFRIYRDMRFSKDKSPYKTNLGGTIAPKGMDSGNPGYYLHIEPNKSFFGGGIHMPDPKILEKLRKSIDKDDTKLRNILKKTSFRKHFKGFEKYDTLKTIPRGYAKDHPSADLLRLKSFTVFKSFSNSVVTSNNFAKLCIEIARVMLPLQVHLRSISSS